MNSLTTKKQDLHRFRHSGGHSVVDDLMAEINQVKISQRLQQARKDAGLTQQEMADLMHLHKRSIEDYESVKKATIPFDRLDEWARYTDTSTEELLYGDGVRLIPASDQALDSLRTDLSAVQQQVGEILQLLRRLAGTEA